MPEKSAAEKLAEGRTISLPTVATAENSTTLAAITRKANINKAIVYGLVTIGSALLLATPWAPWNYVLGSLFLTIALVVALFTNTLSAEELASLFARISGAGEAIKAAAEKKKDGDK